MKGAWRAVAGLLVLAACGEVEPVVESFVAPPASPREGYVRELERAGLGETALVRDWRSAGDAALSTAPAVPQAFRETVAIDRAGSAHAWRVPVRRGQRLRVFVDSDADTPVFLDAFDPRDDADAQPDGIGSADAGERTLDVEPWADGTILVRAQPGLLAGGRFTVTLRVEPTLSFPVAGHGMPDVGSIFGDPRDGGVRDHHGIDIFAPRGTPVVAATAGTVSRVRTTQRGGRVVWLRAADRRQSLYYAHLDSQLVSDGMRVEPGDTLGLVGNSGNARTTPPHLHFGIYSRGPVDPVPFVRPVSARLPDVSRDTALVGEWMRTAGGETVVRAAPGESRTLARLPRNTAVRVVAASADWLRVVLPDGSVGFVTARATEDADAPLEQTVVASESPVRSAPAAGAPVVATLASGATVNVHARFGDYVWIRSVDGPSGWIPTGS